MEKNKIKVYIKLDGNNCITEINSSIFLKDISHYTYIDEGIGLRYAHAQNYYFPKEKPLRDNQGRCNYKHENNEVVELTEDEKLNLFPVQEKEPTETEILQKQLLETQAIVANLQEQILLNQNGGK
ncbi:hypothetical protein [Clostridium butyricum]|uniref:hypothetical protein n=1 Tax=Clostridium butyricum TaxID=1492 RepID=UPI0013D022AE|nr:hypothetical protein [Clostridium butyricum]MCQ2017484.1 hypothetical protein [Clostridium butyricum]MCQ2023042.1 hypothetical protein [Clostridium butyricum]NFB71944.1 hypothetical protein [Clostridium butyricum]NFB91924.1 hypothetical protein [Clostridium butyricum]UTY53311.1 hypothetical protein HNS01_09510 [Clostridium butyricum]